LVILQTEIAGLNEAALDRFLLRARKAAGLRGPVNVLVTSSTAIRSLNRQFRGHNQATDVLSFPAPSPSGALRSRKRAELAGEIAISADVARQNAARLKHSVVEEVKILALHGILHLAGFDHERDNGEMARKEATLRVALRLPAALIERVEFEPAEPAQAAKKKSAKPRRGAARAGRRMA
jgi:probable rRNA maturation factor